MCLAVSGWNLLKKEEKVKIMKKMKLVRNLCVLVALGGLLGGCVVGPGPGPYRARYVHYNGCRKIVVVKVCRPWQNFCHYRRRVRWVC